MGGTGPSEGGMIPTPVDRRPPTPSRRVIQDQERVKLVPSGERGKVIKSCEHKGRRLYEVLLPTWHTVLVPADMVEPLVNP